MAQGRVNRTSKIPNRDSGKRGGRTCQGCLWPQVRRKFRGILAPFAALVTAVALATATPALLLRAFLARTGNIDRERAALKFFIVELFDGLVRLLVAPEFNECEATGFSSHLIEHKIDGGDDASLGEIILKIIFHGLVGQVTYEEPSRIHNTRVVEKTAWEDCTGRITECRLRFTLSSDTNTVSFNPTGAICNKPVTVVNRD